MAKVLIGRDVTMYVWQGGGYDDGTFNAGVAQNIIGRWRKITLEASPDWFEVSSSDADLKERRRGPMDWRSTLETFERSAAVAGGGASLALSLITNHDYVYVAFTEETDGFTVQLWGGVERARLERDKEAAMDTLEVINVGGIGPNGVSLLYTA